MTHVDYSKKEMLSKSLKKLCDVFKKKKFPAWIFKPKILSIKIQTTDVGAAYLAPSVGSPKSKFS